MKIKGCHWLVLGHHRNGDTGGRFASKCDLLKTHLLGPTPAIHNKNKDNMLRLCFIANLRTYNIYSETPAMPRYVQGSWQKRSGLLVGDSILRGQPIKQKRATKSLRALLTACSRSSASYRSPWVQREGFFSFSRKRKASGGGPKTELRFGRAKESERGPKNKVLGG